MVVAGCTPGNPGDDQTNNNSNDSTVPFCGNARIELGEQCDSGSANSDTQTDACRTNCTFAGCGDGVVDTGEGCDLGAGNGDFPDARCRRDCRPRRCGDGIIDPVAGEVCDDENGAGGDGCDDTCVVEHGWSCQGVPSVCSCAAYWSGAACDRCVLHVDPDPGIGVRDGTTWATAFASLQIAIDAAAGAGPGCEVWVKRGTHYVFDRSRDDTIELRSWVSVYGGFAGTETSRAARDPATNRTVVSGLDAAGSRRVRHVLSAISVEGASIDGLIVRDGAAFGNEVADRVGGGLYVRDAMVTVRGCTFTGNATEGLSNVSGSGSSLYARDASVIVERSWFSEEDGVSVIYCEDTGMEIRDSVVDANLMYVGVYSEYSSLLAVRTSVANARYEGAFVVGGELVALDSHWLSSSGTGLGCHEGRVELRGGTLSANDTGVRITRCELEVDGARFVGNHSRGALHVIGFSSGTLHNAVLVGNRGDPTGGINVDFISSLHVVNSTLVRNTATNAAFLGGTAFVDAGGALAFTNSIVWDSAPSQFVALGTLDASYCDLDAFVAGSNNRTVAPMFVSDPGISGTWTANAAYDPQTAQSALTDGAASWTAGEHAGRFVRADEGDATDATAPPRWALIVDNSVDTLWVLGDLTVWRRVQGDWPGVEAGERYEIVDLHLTSSSPGRDSAYAPLAPATDADGNPRQGSPDRGAFEYR